MISDTIAAISTPVGEGGISVIRVSGLESLVKVEAIFTSKVKLTQAKSHTVHYGHIKDPQSNERIEEVLVTLMRSPKSFTAEDVVEINCHGGIISVRAILSLLLSQGIRLAEPGEFTKRAFLNGRIDLSQAEAVVDLIRAKSDRAFKVALKQVEGRLSQNIKQLRQKLVELIAHIEVNIDYPEHDAGNLTHRHIMQQCTEIILGIDRLLKTANEGKIIRDGIVTAIIGRPNVGKSSLLNALAQDNKAIVTDIPGTTRDVIEEYVTMNGIVLKLLDTAGIRETDNVIEKIGVERSRLAIEDADLILLVLNGAERLQHEDMMLVDQLKNRNTIVIVNKTDLPQLIDLNVIYSHMAKERVVLLSVKQNHGFSQLENVICELFFQGDLATDDYNYVSNVRHIHLLELSKQSLYDAIGSSENGIPIDIVQIDIKSAWEQLGEIVGDSAADSLLDQIFSQFCLGK